MANVFDRLRKILGIANTDASLVETAEALVAERDKLRAENKEMHAMMDTINRMTGYARGGAVNTTVHFHGLNTDQFRRADPDHIRRIMLQRQPIVRVNRVSTTGKF